MGSARTFILIYFSKTTVFKVMWGNDKTKENKGVFQFYRNSIQERATKQFTLDYTISIEIARKIDRFQHLHSSIPLKSKNRNINRTNRKQPKNNYRFASCHSATTSTGVYRCAAESRIYTPGIYAFHMNSITPCG